MRKSCRYCGGTHAIGEECALAPPKWQRPPRSTAAAAFRRTHAWTRKALQIKQRDMFLCKCCMMDGIVTTDELEAHHIVPIEENYDLRLDDDNIITLCSRHHRLADSGRISREQLRDLISDIPPRGVGELLSGGSARPRASPRTHKIP